MKSFVRPAALAALACATLWAVSASAQVYRIVGPDGRVTFSDRPPPDAKATEAQTLPLGGGAATASLPFELRNAANRFPVTLYTGPGCAPCGEARSFLASRGVPYTERTVTSNQDIAALRRLAGQPVLPFATIGGQHLVGFAEPSWAEYLDAAGYPKTSQLPPSYRNPPATPLVAEQPIPDTSAQRSAPPAQAQRNPAAESPGPTPSNPAGIRF